MQECCAEKVVSQVAPCSTIRTRGCRFLHSCAAIGEFSDLGTHILLAETPPQSPPKPAQPTWHIVAYKGKLNTFTAAVRILQVLRPRQLQVSYMRRVALAGTLPGGNFTTDPLVCCNLCK